MLCRDISKYPHERHTEKRRSLAIKSSAGNGSLNRAEIYTSVAGKNADFLGTSGASEDKLMTEKTVIQSHKSEWHSYNSRGDKKNSGIRPYPPPAKVSSHHQPHRLTSVS